MKREINLNTIIWLFLVAIICVNMLFSENSFQNAYLIITALSIVKFLSVIFQFVEVKNAHIFWKILSTGFVVVYLIGVIVLY